ncbi:MAG: ABC transporter ATP-binding protein [Clostridia bacterium]|nr:ABC transporter ATP-binding protein [Clostridia bacterium]
MDILVCSQLTRVYGSGDTAVRALSGVDLHIAKGEFAAIVGASGSGKSTLLHILASIDQPTSGRVCVDGVDLSSLGARQAALFRRRKVGLIYQFYNLIPSLTVERNILLPMRLDHRAPDPAFWEQLVSSLGLSDKLSALPGQLSGGQQQRAAIARALLYRPALVLADEPTGNLDRRSSREVIDLLAQCSRAYGQTVVMVTHDEQAALSADRVITLSDGRVVADRRRG